jgi:dCTP deaminase
MSVLSRSEILAQLAAGSLVVSPTIDSKVEINRASMDLRLGTTAAIVRGSDLSHVDPKGYIAKDGSEKHLRERGRRRKLERLSVPFGSPLMLHVGNLILVNTFEWVKLPNDLSGVVTARSSWAREGLSIATATLIEPCYNGVITLELANLGQIPIALYPGLRIAQIAFHTVQGGGEIKPCGDDPRKQFNLAFEPTAGDITKDDERFLRGPKEASK